MMDIYFAIGVVTLISAIAGAGAYAFARRSSRPISIVAAIATAGLIVWNVALFRHSLWPARVFPFSNMIVFADPNPELGSILAGLSLARTRMLIELSGVSTVSPLARIAARCAPRATTETSAPPCAR